MRGGFLKRFVADEQGGPAMEFALIAALVAITIPAFFDLSGVIRSNMKLAAGMRAGQQFTLKYPTNSTGIRQAVLSASGLPAANLTVNTSAFCECSGVSISCSGTCAQNQPPGRFTNVTATYAHPTLYTYHGLFSNPYNITQSIAVRTQ